MPKTVTEGWLSSEDAARRLGIGTRTLYRMIDAGEIIAYRLGRVLRLREEDIDRYLDGCRVKPGELGRSFEPKKRDEWQRPVWNATQRDAAIVAAYNAGGRVDDIAQQLRVGKNTVVRALDAAGVERKRGPRRSS